MFDGVSKVVCRGRDSRYNFCEDSINLFIRRPTTQGRHGGSVWSWSHRPWKMSLESPGSLANAICRPEVSAQSAEPPGIRDCTCPH